MVYRKLYLKVIALLVAFALIFTLFPEFLLLNGNATAMGTKEEPTEQKVLSKASLEDDFADNAILIVLNKNATRRFKEYTKEDFAGINIAKINNLTSYTAEMVKRKILLNSENIKSDEKRTMTQQRLLDIDAQLTDTSASGKEAWGSERISNEIIENFRGILYIELAEKSKENVLATIKKLEENEDFLYVGPDHHVYMCATPNDIDYGEQWGLQKIQAPGAWDKRTDAANSILVGIIDSGIRSDHPDLINQMYHYRHRDFITGVPSGVEVQVENLIDPYGHGTHVAGIIGAQGNNSIGGTGVCWDVKLVSLRVFDANGNCNMSNVINAIEYAQSSGIDILNMSFGTPSYNAALETAIRNYSGLVVAAAGNNNINTDNIRVYPASFTDTLKNVISVGATDTNDERSDWNSISNLWGLLGSSKSNYGKNTVDIFAPGTDIYSTLRNGAYGKMSGTSMAAPYVTGVAALMMSANTTLEPSDIKAIIIHAADTIPDLAGICVSGGRLNAAGAVTAASNTLKMSIGENARYTEKTVSINTEAGYKDCIVKFSNGGNKVIQTFGASTLSHDGYLEIYDMMGNMLDYDDDGYERNALISYTFQAGVTYRIRIRFYNTSNQSGLIRMAIISTYHYNTYEDMHSISDNTGDLTWGFEQNNVKIMTYQYTTPQVLTMRVDSEVDTYLYIIDPSSVDLCYQVKDSDDITMTMGYPSVCNDDYTDDTGAYSFNSRLTKLFEAGIPYLVVVSAYNPSLSSSTGSFCVSFE